MKIILAQPRGFCAGVERAVKIVERALEKYGAPVYVRHQIVHNQHVVDNLRAKGAIFVERLDEIPPNSITIFSAHGVAQRVEEEAKQRALQVIDATCPLVSKVHKEAQKYVDSGHELILIGHRGHPEVEGTMGRVSGKVHLIATLAEVADLQVEATARLSYVTQTTLSVDDTGEMITALKQRFPETIGPDTRDICYATQHRQQAVRELAKRTDLILVVGASNSSNASRLQELAQQQGVRSYLIADAAALDPAWVAGVDIVGITAGASTPEILVQELVEHLRMLGATDIEVLPGVEEKVHFKMPTVLATASSQASNSH